MVVEGSSCRWWTGALFGRGHGRFWLSPGLVLIIRSASASKASTKAKVSPRVSRAAWTAALALRVWRIDHDERWLRRAAYWVFAQTTRTG